MNMSIRQYAHIHCYTIKQPCDSSISSREVKIATMHHLIEVLQNIKPQAGYLSILIINNCSL